MERAHGRDKPDARARRAPAIDTSRRSAATVRTTGSPAISSAALMACDVAQPAIARHARAAASQMTHATRPRNPAYPPSSGHDRVASCRLVSATRLRMTSHRIEGGIFTVMVIAVVDPYDPAFTAAIGEQVAQSPGFFVEAPVVLDVCRRARLHLGRRFRRAAATLAPPSAHGGGRAERERDPAACGAGDGSRDLSRRRRGGRGPAAASRRRRRRRAGRASLPIRCGPARRSTRRTAISSSPRR